MKKVLILNTGNSPLSIAGGLLPTGSQRWVDPVDITPGLKKYVVKPQEAAKSGDSSGDEAKAFDPETFLARSLRDMEDDLKTLSKDQLTALKTHENATEGTTPRKNVVDAIDVALLKAER